GVPGAAPEWAPTEVYSNADGSVQFAVLSAYDGGQQFLGGYPLVVRTLGSSAQRAFIYPNDLPGDSFGRDFLVATQGFADLHVLRPDYVVPNGFFPVQGGIICVTEESLSCYEYLGLPTDGVRAFWQSPDDFWWYGVAVAKNF